MIHIKKTIFILIAIALCMALHAQDKMYIHRNDGFTLGASVRPTDSILFLNSGYTVIFKIGETSQQYEVGEIDSLTFGEHSTTVSIHYNNDRVTVINPLAFEGVVVEVHGAKVTVYADTETRDISYRLSGNSADGMFKLYSQKRFTLLMDGLSLTNQNGPAINIQSNNKGSVFLADGTSNFLSDGTTYEAAPYTNGKEEDQKAAFFSEGKLYFSGAGRLTILGKGIDKHALCSDDLIQFDSGVLSVTCAGNDGVRGKDGVVIYGGTMAISSSGDAIDGGEGAVMISAGSITINNTAVGSRGITCDSIMHVSGGNIEITMSGNQSKAIKSGQDLYLDGGTVTIKTTGGVVLEPSGSGYDPSYCTAIKSDGDIYVDGSTIKINSSGIAGKGISSDKDLFIKKGTVDIVSTGTGNTYTNISGAKDSYNATCITANGSIYIVDGHLTTSASGSAGKGITADGSITFGSGQSSPVVDVTTKGSKITITTASGGGFPGGGGSSGSYNEAKAIKCTGKLTIQNGTLTISSSDDGLKSNEAVIVNNGAVNILTSVEGFESPAITFNGGTVNVVASDDAINATKGTVSGGTESNDGSLLAFNGGYIVASTTKGDAVDCNGNIVMTGGTVIVHGPPSQPEEAFDFNGTFVISGGLLIGAGTNSSMSKAMSATSSQYCIYAKSSSAVTANSIFRIQDASGKELVTFKPERNSYTFYFSSPELAAGSYSIYTGGTSTGGTQSNGLVKGGSYSGGTLKKSFSISGKVTSVAF